MKIGTCISKPGKLTKGKLTVANYKGKNLDIQILIAKGKYEGKTVFISAGMHGDEINSIETIYHVMKEISLSRLSGTIIFLPSLNPWGFRLKKRYIPFDNKDLNRCFHGKGTSTTFKIAKTILEKIVKKCDFGIDLHDSGSKNILLPHPRILKDGQNQFLKEMSYAFGSEIILEREGEKGMLATQSLKRFNVPVLTVEIGGALVLREDFIEQGVNGIKNILIYNDMLQGVLDLPIRQFFLQERQGYLSNIYGILHIYVDLGQAVNKDQVLAKIHNPLDETEQIIKSTNPGVIFSIRQSSIIDKGESILSILHFKEKRNWELVPVQAKMLLNKKKFRKVITRPTTIIDDMFSILGFSYKLVGKTIKTPFKKLEEYLK